MSDQEHREPPRWIDGGGPPGVEELLRAARKTNPSIQHVDRIGHRLGVPAVEGALGAKTLVGVGGLLAAGLVGASVLFARAPSEAARPSAEVAPAVPSSVSEPERHAPERVELRSAPVPSAAASSSVTRTEIPARPTEVELLREARALLTEKPRRALALLERHRAFYPKGKLAEERELLAIRAHRALGQAGEATKRAASFAVDYPGSAHQESTGR